MQMKKVARKGGWLYFKYGEQVEPWECRLMVLNQKGDGSGGFFGKKFQIEYNYEKISSSNPSDSINERDPLRKL
jgi:hypothetical protein